MLKSNWLRDFASCEKREYRHFLIPFPKFICCFFIFSTLSSWKQSLRLIEFFKQSNVCGVFLLCVGCFLLQSFVLYHIGIFFLARISLVQMFCSFSFDGILSLTCGWISCFLIIYRLIEIENAQRYLASIDQQSATVQVNF